MVSCTSARGCVAEACEECVLVPGITDAEIAVGVKTRPAVMAGHVPAINRGSVPLLMASTVAGHDGKDKSLISDNSNTPQVHCRILPKRISFNPPE